MTDEEIILNGQVSLDFFNFMRHPDWKAIERRDKFIKGTGKNTIKINSDGSGSIHMPLLDEEEEKQRTTTNYKLAELHFNEWRAYDWIMEWLAQNAQKFDTKNEKGQDVWG